jgi:uncharacterized radical SAM superfamily Fe-S cluster-containing enzyme
MSAKVRLAICCIATAPMTGVHYYTFYEEKFLSITQFTQFYSITQLLKKKTERGAGFFLEARNFFTIFPREPLFK